jgi:RNA polymerase sigma-70 factor (ECF subfamily)
MSQEHSFADLIRRVRDQDTTAAAELVRRYEPAIRRAVRIKLVDARLRRVLDSMDICQSVLGSFFTGPALDKYELDSPEHLLKLLTNMVRNKVIDQVRRQRAERRDHRRVVLDGADICQFVAAEPEPGQQLAMREYYQEVRRRLTADDRLLLERREQGQHWSEIAAELGSSPEALRKRLARALGEAARQLEPEGEP